MACKNFIMKVVDKTWYKELEDPDTFYTNAAALKRLDHLTKLFLVSIPSMPWTSHN